MYFNKYATYNYIMPIYFGDKKCTDSYQFIYVVRKNWDAALTTYKSGDWSDLFSTHTDLPEEEAAEMQRRFDEPLKEMFLSGKGKNPDVLFTKAIYWLEPNDP